MKLSTPSRSTVIAVTALVLASVGTAGAATTMITGANVVNGTLTGADVKDRKLGGIDLKQGSVGAIPIANGSLSGLDIADGGLGTPDLADASVNGAKVADASLGAADMAPGELAKAAHTGTLPSGTTVRGAWAVQAPNPFATAGDNTAGSAVSLPLLAPAPLASTQVEVGAGTPGSTDTNAVCSGTAEAPTAPAGVACIYVSDSTNANVVGYSIGTTTTAAANAYGFRVNLVGLAGAPGQKVLAARGTWAYTAP